MMVMPLSILFPSMLSLLLPPIVYAVIKSVSPWLETNTTLCGVNTLLFFFLQTLGHLEKAVVLELTLKHVKALTSLIEQQQQQIIALQKGLHAGEYSTPSMTLKDRALVIAVTLFPAHLF